jgi:hypothetical protein
MIPEDPSRVKIPPSFTSYVVVMVEFGVQGIVSVCPDSTVIVSAQTGTVTEHNKAERIAAARRLENKAPILTYFPL